MILRFFQALGRVLFSRVMLASVVLIVGGLALWFLGPLLSFGGLRPLQSASMRVAAIVLLLVVLLFLIMRWSLLLVGVAVLCLLIWQAGPLLAVGEASPLGPVWVRASIIATILVVYAAYGLYRLYQALRADEHLVQRLLHPGADKPQSIAKEQIRTLAGIVQRGVAQLRRMRVGSGVLRRLVEGKRYLYELPWYMVVGTPDTGKTSVLLNSGLKFPMADQMGSASARVALSTAGSTTNSHWWFTNEAVLIDTAGRYTQPEDLSSSPPVPNEANGAPLNATPEQINRAEWLGYLGLLRKYRPRAPINGVLLAIDVRHLADLDAVARTRQAAALRARLAELRQELGVRFPVYVLVTKCDSLCGFGDYFGPLTEEGRAQVWGFTLPWQSDREARATQRAQQRQARQRGRTEPGHEISPLRQAIDQELTLLRQRLEDGLSMRLQEEFDLPRRQRLYALPQEFGGVAPALAHMLEEVFLDSRYDATELTHSLRGVYFTSAHQEDNAVVAEPDTLVARLLRALHQPVPTGFGTSGNRSFFVQDVLSRVVFPEAHLVRPNLRWELRFRMARLLGHALAVVLFVWLASALVVSYHHNRAYLADTSRKTEELSNRLNGLFAKFRMDEVPDVLSTAQALPTHHGLDLDDPANSYRYGLYTAPPVTAAASHNYAQLQDALLLPQVIRRMETVLSKAISDQDARTAYATLRVYLMLHDKARFHAQDIQSWVLADSQTDAGAKVFGDRALMLSHLEAMFAGGRIVQSASVQNEALVQRARNFLNGNNSTARLYERAKTAMQADAPQDFTLLRVVGPQAGTVFTRASGQPLEQGVPGLFTYEGYHEVFSKRLPELVAKAYDDDAWVMGTSAGVPFALNSAAQKKNADLTDAWQARVGPLAEDIRRQYLTEYAQAWDDFLNDIRPVTGSTLAFDLSVVRQYAAPDSPLARLARAAVRETTLTRPLDVAVPEEEQSLFDKASAKLTKQANDVKKKFGLRDAARIERQLVDSRFSALREVVTGQADAGMRGTTATGSAAGAAGAKPGLDNVTNLINEFYTVLVMADTAMTTNAVPQAGADAGAKLRLEGSKLPAPFRDVLTALANAGTEKVAQGASDILRVQAQAQMDRLLALMSAQVTDYCRRAIEGRYPVAPVREEINGDDFNRFFAAGGVADAYFTKYLGPFVDTSNRPWRYKSPDTANQMTPIESAGDAAKPASTGPTLTGELLKLLAQNGPNPDAFARIAQIREVYFRETDAKKLAWKMDIKVAEMDPSITELVMNFDGQGQRYFHGPVQTMPVNWPGPRGGTVADLTAMPRIHPDTSTIASTGPWAMHRLVERGRVLDGTSAGRASVEFQFDGRRAVLDFNSGSGPNPLTSNLLRNFKCPGMTLRGDVS